MFLSLYEVKKDKKKTARRERSIGEIGGKKGKIKIKSEDREKYYQDLQSILNGEKDEHILDYRQIAKIQSTYIEGLLKVIDKRTGKIHTRYMQTIAQTGRLSSVEPNLQNIPVRTDRGKELRKFFCAREGWMLVDADYSQIELRILAHLADDKTMLEAFKNGLDIHTQTAAQVFNIPENMVTPLMRSRAKAVNFGIVYGISGFGLARNAGLSRKEADQFIQTYFQRYPGVRAFMDACVEKGNRTGYAQTMHGRRRELYELRAQNRNVRNFGERAAMNTPVQGTAADIIKLAMVKVSQRLKEEGCKGRLILQVHDELVVECPMEEADRVAALLQQTMENIVTLNVPLVAEVSRGKDWDAAH